MNGKDSQRAAYRNKKLTVFRKNEVRPLSNDAKNQSINLLSLYSYIKIQISIYIKDIIINKNTIFINYIHI